MNDIVDRYYEALDAHAYEQLESVLDPAFVHERPDRTLEGRSTFLQFMRDERPHTDTEHSCEEYFVRDDTVAVEGRLLDADGEQMIQFVDVHQIDQSADRIESLRTYTL